MMYQRITAKRWLQQAGYCPCRWATYILLYNNVHFGEPRLHYEVSRVRGRVGWELGFHFEAKDSNLNRLLLKGFRRHLFEIKDTLGESVEAEMWDKGWTKVYEVYPPASLTTSYRDEVGERLARMMICLHPIFVEIRGSVTAVYR